MRIGVFGDSFVDRYANTWAHRLGSKHGHDIEIFGECGSSLLWSARQIEDRYRDYDLVIWAVTNPGRLSIHDDDQWWHVGHLPDPITNNARVENQRQVYHQYLAHIFDWHTDCWQWRHIINDIMNQCGNIMAVPCFQSPLELPFHLYQVSCHEAHTYFPGQELPEIYQHWQDLRHGHLSDVNHDLLADLVAANLIPGVFQTEYDNFRFDDLKHQQCWSRL